jgi:hypothetical protein
MGAFMNERRVGRISSTGSTGLAHYAGRLCLLLFLCGLGVVLSPATLAGQGTVVREADSAFDPVLPFSAQDRSIGFEPAGTIRPGEANRAQSARPMAVCLGLSVAGLAFIGGVIGYVVRRDSRILAPALEAGRGPVCRRCGLRLDRGARFCRCCDSDMV